MFFYISRYMHGLCLCPFVYTCVSSQSYVSYAPTQLQVKCYSSFSILLTWKKASDCISFFVSFINRTLAS